MRLIITIGLTLALCLGSLAGVADKPGVEGPMDQKNLVQGNTAFALDLYGRLASTKGNLFFSPYSISSALGMTYAGARGQTAEQMAQTLHFGLDPNRLHPAFAA